MNRFQYKRIGNLIALGCIVLLVSGCSLSNRNTGHTYELLGNVERAGVVTEENKDKEIVHDSAVDDQIKEEYIDDLKEDERYLITYEAFGSGEHVVSESGNQAIKLDAMDELIGRLKKSDIGFYIPEYISEGFKLNDIGIYYYLNYDNFNLSMLPIREEELEDGGIFKVYKMEETYQNSIERIYLEYTDGKNTITYRFGLSFSAGYDNGEKNNQFLKEEYDYTLLHNNFRVNQKIEPKEVFTGIPSEENYNYPDYFDSIEMEIEGEEIEQEELLKIANSIYKVN